MLASGPQSALALAGAGDQACRRGLPERSVGKPVTRSWPGGGGVSPEDALSNIFAKLGSRHPDEDICDMYAGADLYGLGAGVYPKDRVPDCPVDANCLCHLTPIYESELQGKHRSDNVEENGDAWLEKQPLHVRQSILGVRGEKEWQEGRLSWTEKAETIENERKSVLAELVNGQFYCKPELVDSSTAPPPPLRGPPPPLKRGRTGRIPAGLNGVGLLFTFQFSPHKKTPVT